MRPEEAEEMDEMGDEIARLQCRLAQAQRNAATRIAHLEAQLALEFKRAGGPVSESPEDQDERMKIARMQRANCSCGKEATDTARDGRNFCESCYEARDRIAHLESQVTELQRANTDLVEANRALKGEDGCAACLVDQGILAGDTAADCVW